MMNRILKHTAFVTLSTLSSLTIAQAPEQHENTAYEPEEVVVRGARDAALRAFDAGDFATAEVEFKKNARCALRLERSQQNFNESIQSAALNQSIQATALTNVAASNTSGAFAFNANPNTGALNNQAARNDKSLYEQERDFTCTNRAYQLYMTGLSQIQLKRIKDAQKSLKSAVALNRSLYDAQYKLALIDLTQNNTQAAKKRLPKLKKVLHKCRNCEDKKEIQTRVVHLEKLLSTVNKTRK